MVTLAPALEFVLGACMALFGGEVPRVRPAPLDPLVALCHASLDDVRGRGLPILGLVSCIIATGALARIGRQKGLSSAAASLAAAALLLASAALALSPMLCPALDGVGSLDTLPALSVQGGPGLASAAAGLALTALHPPLATHPKDVLAQLLCIIFYTAWGAPELRNPAMAAATAADLLAVLARPLQPLVALVGADTGVAATLAAFAVASCVVVGLTSTAAAARLVGALRAGALALLCCLALDGTLRFWLAATVGVAFLAGRHASAPDAEEEAGPPVARIALGPLGLPWTALALAQWVGAPADAACAGATVALALTFAASFLWPHRPSSSALSRAAFFQSSLAITDAVFPPSMGAAAGAARLAAAALASSGAAQRGAAPRAVLVLRTAFALPPLACAARGLEPAVCGPSTAAASSAVGLLLAALPGAVRRLARPAEALTLAVAVLATAPHAVHLASAAAAAQGVSVGPLPGHEWWTDVAVASDAARVAGTVAARTKPAMPAFAPQQPCVSAAAGRGEGAPWWSHTQPSTPAFDTGDSDRVAASAWCPVFGAGRLAQGAAPALPLHHALDAEQTARRVFLAHRAADAALAPASETAADVIMALAGLHLALTAVRAWAREPSLPAAGTKGTQAVPARQPRPTTQAAPPWPRPARRGTRSALPGSAGPTSSTPPPATPWRRPDPRGKSSRRRTGSGAAPRPSLFALDSDVSDAGESSGGEGLGPGRATAWRAPRGIGADGYGTGTRGPWPDGRRGPAPPAAPWSDPRASSSRGPSRVPSARPIVRRRRRHRTPQPSLSPEPL